MVKTSSILLVAVGLMAVISVACIWFYPSVQDLAAANSLWNGMKEARDDLGVEVINTLDTLPGLPLGAALVAVPNREYTEGELSRIEEFTRGGGRLVLMDDYGYGNQVLSRISTGITFVGKPLLDPLFCYRNAFMPRATDFSQDMQAENIAVITLDRATALGGVGASEAIAWSSPTSFLDTNGDGAWQEDEPQGPLCVAAAFRLGNGWVYAIASPGMMINSLYDRDDNLSFLRKITGAEAGGGVYLDGSHLSTRPLDVSKIRLAEIRDLLSSPYVVMGILLLVFAAASAYTMGKGEILGSRE